MTTDVSGSHGLEQHAQEVPPLQVQFPKLPTQLFAAVWTVCGLLAIIAAGAIWSALELTSMSGVLHNVDSLVNLAKAAIAAAAASGSLGGF